MGWYHCRDTGAGAHGGAVAALRRSYTPYYALHTTPFSESLTTHAGEHTNMKSSYGLEVPERVWATHEDTQPVPSNAKNKM